MLGEFGLDCTLVVEEIWERRHGFLALNPAGTTPVYGDENAPSIPGPGPIAEYLDETRGLALGDQRLLPEGLLERVEVRRLLDWFNGKMHQETTGPLVMEKVYKRFMSSAQGGGGPEMTVVRAARANLRTHLAYIDYLCMRRRWLAGETLSYADLAAAAQLSCIDYLGDVPWSEHEAAKIWYGAIKSRPSFRPLLADRLAGMPPAEHYADLDF